VDAENEGMVGVKAIIVPMLSPLAISLGILVLGVFLLWCSRKQRTGKVLVLVSLVLLTTISIEGISGRLLRTLESQYPPINLSPHVSEPASGESLSRIKWIVILGSGEAAVDHNMPYHWQISQHARVRLMEAIRLHRAIPDSKLILTGGMGFGKVPEWTTLSRVAEEMGVARCDMVLEVEARNTKDHPLYVRNLVQSDPFILVTSAFHMPRAMKMFEKQGLSPIPAPAGFWSPPDHLWSWVNFSPTATGVRLAELAFHEYLGLAWAWLRGQI
jgi:uncharacterized SAM-binding protein YcdF (DUF218 family)